MQLYFNFNSLLAAAPEAANPEPGAPSMMGVWLPLLAVVILMFWFQRRLRVDQYKRKAHQLEEHTRHRAKLSQTLDRILQARQPPEEDKPSNPDSLP